MKYIVVWVISWSFIAVGAALPELWQQAVGITISPLPQTCSPPHVPLLPPVIGAFIDLVSASFFYNSILVIIPAALSLGLHSWLYRRVGTQRSRLSVKNRIYVAGLIVGVFEALLLGLPIAFVRGISMNFSLDDCAMPCVNDTNIWLASIGIVLAYIGANITGSLVVTPKVDGSRSR